MSTITLDRNGFACGVRAAVHCVGGASRPEAQQCLCIEIGTTYVDIVSTNGCMLARWREPIVAGTIAPRQLLVANHKELVAWLKSAKGDTAAIDIDTGRIEASASATVFTAKMCSETFPRYEEIVKIVEREAAEQSALVKRLRKHAKQFDTADLPEYADVAKAAAKALTARSVRLSTAYAGTTERCFRSAKLDGCAWWTGALDPIVSRSCDPEQALLVITMPMRQRGADA